MSDMTRRLAAWLVTRREWVMLAGCIVLAVYFRFWHLGTTPPALAAGEAASGLAARHLVEHFSAAELMKVWLGRDGLFTLLQAVAVAVMGHTATAIRIVPSLIGVLAVVTSYVWAKAWWNRRIALVAALVMAVTPWAVILERTAYSVGLVTLLATLALWLGTQARWTGRAIWAAAAGVVVGLGCYAYPGGWPIMAGIAIAIGVGLVWRTPKLPMSRALIYLLAAAVVALPFAFSLGWSTKNIVKTPVASVVDKSVNHGNPTITALSATGKNLLLVNYHGDANYAHNVGGEPQLNVFVGIMAVFGLLICLTMIKRPRYLALVALLVLGLLSGIIGAGTAPDALRTLAALVPLAVMAGIGVDQMLVYWYKTFPINSAARTVGLASMLMLLALSVYHSYTAYFVAWADAPGTYAAQNESTTQLANYLTTYQSKSNRVVVVDPELRGIVRYLAPNPEKLQFIVASEIAGLPEKIKPAQFIIDRSQRDASVASLRVKFSGGTLRPHYSDHSDEEIYVVYETAK